MDKPVASEVFLTRQPPRCLRPRPDINPDATTPIIRRRAAWPLRASFEAWALKLLAGRSGKPG